MDVSDDLEAQARRADADRWLASRFIADPARRADVIAVYAFDHQLARVPRVVREPMMAEIRLTWWRESVEGLFAGTGARGHPVLTALGQAITRRGLTPAPLLAMVEARFSDIADEAFADTAGVQGYAQATSGAAMTLAMAALVDADPPAIPASAALAWSLARLSQTRPARLHELADVRGAGLAALREARGAIAALPVAGFPAVAHLALATPYLRGRKPGELERRLRLMLATLTGRV